MLSISAVMPMGYARELEISALMKCEKASAFAKAHDAKVYVAANMVTHEGNEVGAGEWFRTLRDLGISAVIVSDPALIAIAASEALGLPIHLSTQASATNYETLEFGKISDWNVSFWRVKFQWRNWQ